MDSNFLNLYEQELAFLREQTGEFARENPGIAGRLGMNQFQCADPYVERLLEGFAFMAARVRLKLESEFPKFTQSLLETIYPHYLAPTPSMLIVQFQPDMASVPPEGFTLPRHTSIRTFTGKGDHQTSCEYRTAHSVTMWPLVLKEACYFKGTSSLNLPNDVYATLRLPKNSQIEAGIRIRLATSAVQSMNELNLDHLDVYIEGVEGTAVRIYEQLTGHCLGTIVRPHPAKAWQPRVAEQLHVQALGFDADQAMLQFSSRSFHGYRLLHEYFAFPQRYMFVRLSGLKAALEGINSQDAEIVFLLDKDNPKLINNVDASNLALYCTPAVNLFERTAIVDVNKRFSEQRVVVDKTCPRDYEVHSVLEAIGDPLGAKRRFRSFYSSTSESPDTREAYYVTHRLARVATAREKQYGRRSSSYSGSDVTISIVDHSCLPYDPDLQELQLKVLVSNSDLPLLHRTDGQSRSDYELKNIGAPCTAINCLAFSPPRPAFSEKSAWRLISHLSLNYLSLIDLNDEEGLFQLRQELVKCLEEADQTIRQQIEDVQALDTSRNATTYAELLRICSRITHPRFVARIEKIKSEREKQAVVPLREMLRLYAEIGDAKDIKEIEGLLSVEATPVVRSVATPGPLAFIRGLRVTIRIDENAFEGGSAGAFRLATILEKFFSKYVSINSFTETVLCNKDGDLVKQWQPRIGQRHIL